ncbi:hypothetical protein MVES1_002962 [Malassezia vespertilionis]|uniref:NEDD8-activating enzyme E1 regulatory subunit n=1 Tax=Malassezia vespertilionis TaxID=2020962 RepID=A0A2N1J8T4_9BASI|nr:uncharacterized protein MVES1_002962 [Malassezia vespertilionis]PKI82971.1 hypothetical protein MVES_002811 [Malassezia vespertilionis]WFD07595.1 hypothetical protein MVES1_002962 [Malassezia vespertilionis]
MRLTESANATQRPDGHTQRYDRQLRIWNKTGQVCLEQARVLVVGASSLSAQILKNLVLPGLGGFTVLDDALVTLEDAGSNFFLEPHTSVGKPYADEMARLLAEMNPSVEHAACVVSPAAMLTCDPSYFTKFSLIILVRQPWDVQERVDRLVWEHSPAIPVLSADNVGFQGIFRTSVRELGIIETHPESLVDLRLTRPFPALEAYADSFDVHPSSSLDMGHIPYVVLLLRALKEWKETHGELPWSATRADFLAFLQRRCPRHGDLENYDEAHAALAQHVWRPLQSPAIPPSVEGILNDIQSLNVNQKSSIFWLLVAALRAFVAEEHVLPLPGALPDMKATSNTYVALQQVYVTKARQDLDKFTAHLDRILDRLMLSRDALGLDASQTRTFVKHAAHLKLVRGRCLSQQRTDPDVGAFAAAFADPVNPITVQFLIAFFASDTFLAKYGRFPGEENAFEQDADALFNCAKAYLDEVHFSLSLPDEARLQTACEELARSAHSDIATTAAFLGGIVAQEAIKILTIQYLPLDNALVYDGIVEGVGSIRL